jgi:L-2-hydroxycarboxylate dehydrogenase (NAD+)
MTERDWPCYPAEQLRGFSRQVFMASGVLQSDAELAADILITADLWGFDTHGVARLSNYYDMIVRGHINPHPKLRVIRELPGTATVDGDNGLGLIVGPRANEMAMEKAEAVGLGCVSVCNSSHFGVAGYYPFKSLARGLIGWAMTNTTPQVAPLWGAERMLGTNPIAIAFPGHDEPAILIDMATSTVSYGKIEHAIRCRETTPAGWIIDRHGRPTMIPEEMMAGGAITPLGIDRERGGHKGYCLSAIVDILCGVLSGANWGPFVPPFPYHLKSTERSVGKGVGHLFGAFRIDGFIDLEDFKYQIDKWIRVFRAAKPAPGTSGPLIPGDLEREAETVRLKQGVPLLETVVRDLQSLSARTGVRF